MPSRRGADSAADSDQPERRPAKKRGPRLLKIALLGGAVALLINEDVRSQLLNTLFGAEEEFDYSSLTEPTPPGATEGGQREPGAPWVRAVADDQSESADSPTAEPANRARAVAPSPTAWEDPPPAPPHAVPDPPAADAPPQAARPPGEQPAAPDSPPPALPRDWWSPADPPAAGDDH